MTEKIGLGLRTGHFNYLLKNPQTRIHWFEAITENFINTAGAPLYVLGKIRERYPVALHGVALSIGSVDGLRNEHLKKIKALADRIEPFQISDHFCFSRFGRHQYHELLPLPLTHAMVQKITANIDKAQNYLKRPLVFENISAYAAFPHNEMSEPEFLNSVARASGCKLLLDINNIYVNAANFRFNARRFLRGIDPRHVAQYHLAGFTDLGTHLFDTHAAKIHAPVLKLYREAKQHLGDFPLSLERDDRIPAFPVLERELLRTAALSPTPMPEKFSEGIKPLYSLPVKPGHSLSRETRWQKTIYTRPAEKKERSAGTLSVRGVQRVYRNAYAIRLTSALTEKFIRLAATAGPRQFAKICSRHAAQVISHSEDLGEYGRTMPAFLKKNYPAQKSWHTAARFDLLRYDLFCHAAGAALGDPFAQKVRLSKLLQFIPGQPGTILYRDHFAVKEAPLSAPELEFLAALKKPCYLENLLKTAEAEKRLSAAAVKRLFRILGLPGILI